MQFDEVIKRRKSVKKFNSKKPSWKQAIEAINSATKGPFAGNMHHLSYIIVEDQEIIDKIAEASDQLWINKSQLIIAIVSDDTFLEKLYGDRGRVYSRQESGAAINSILLKLVDLGLSACWVGEYPDNKVRQLLDIPSNIQIEAIIPLGYELEGANSKKRKIPLETVIRWDSWKNKNRKALLKDPEVSNLKRILDIERN